MAWEHAERPSNFIEGGDPVSDQHMIVFHGVNNARNYLRKRHTYEHELSDTAVQRLRDWEACRIPHGDGYLQWVIPIAHDVTDLREEP